MKQSKFNLHVEQTSGSKLRSWRPTSLHILYVFFINAPDSNHQLNSIQFNSIQVFLYSAFYAFQWERAEPSVSNKRDIQNVQSTQDRHWEPLEYSVVTVNFLIQSGSCK